MASDAEFAEIPRHELVAAALELGVERPDRFSDEELATRIRLQSSAGAPVRPVEPPSWLSVARNLVASVIEQGLNLPEAARVLRATVASAPRQKAPLPTVTLAQIYLAQKHTELAQTTLEQVLRRDPDNYKARQILLRLQASQGAKTSEPSSLPSTPPTAAGGSSVAPAGALSQPPLPGVDLGVSPRAETPRAELSDAPAAPIQPDATALGGAATPEASAADVLPIDGIVQAVVELTSLTTSLTSAANDTSVSDESAANNPAPHVEATALTAAPVELPRPLPVSAFGSDVEAPGNAAPSQGAAHAVESSPPVVLEVNREPETSDCVLRWDVTALRSAGVSLQSARLGIQFATFVPTARGALQFARWIPLTEMRGALRVAVARRNSVRACVALRAPGGDLRVLCVAPTQPS